MIGSEQVAGDVPPLDFEAWVRTMIARKFELVSGLWNGEAF